MTSPLFHDPPYSIENDSPLSTLDRYWKEYGNHNFHQVTKHIGAQEGVCWEQKETQTISW